MRIRRCASKLLGSDYCSTSSALPPLFHLPPPPPAAACGSSCRNGSPGATSGVICELSMSPWDLVAELDLSSPQEELDDEYFVKLAGKESCRNVNSVDVKIEEGAKKRKAARKVKVKKEEEVKDVGGDATFIWTCKKNDGKRWQCSRPTSRPNSLCDYHLSRRRSYYTPNYENPSTVSSTAATRSCKGREKKEANNVHSSEASSYYYYAGFGPFRGNRRNRSNMGATESEEETAPHQDDTSELCHIAGIAGGDEESEDDGSDGCTGDADRRRSDGSDVQRRAVTKRSHRKRGRKPVKARSLKSLLL